MKLKKIAAAAVAMAMAVSMLSVPVFAAEGESVGTDSNGTLTDHKASTTVNVIYSNDASQLSVTVPISVTFAVKSNGEFVCPTNYKLVNKSVVPVYVDDISVTEVTEGYSLVASATTAKQIQLTMKAGSDTTGLALIGTNSQTYTKSNWEMAATTNDEGTPLAVSFSGKAGAAESAWAKKDATQLFKIVYTIKAGTSSDAVQ